MLAFGNDFEEKNLRKMMQFANQFPDEAIVAMLWRQLNWSHFKLLLHVKDELQWNFYAQLCRVENWNVATLHQKLQSMLFERTALSKKAREPGEIGIEATDGGK